MHDKEAHRLAADAARWESVDIGYLASIFRGVIGHKQLDQGAIYLSTTALWTGVTEYDTGRGMLVDAIKTADVVEAIEASTAMLAAYRNLVAINGVRYVDGCAGMPFPVREVAGRFLPSCILVLANRCAVDHDSALRRAINRVLLLQVPKSVRSAYLCYNEIFVDELTWLRRSGIPYLIVSSDDRVAGMTQDPVLLRHAARDAYDHMLGLIRAGT